MEAIKAVFQAKRAEGSHVLVAFVTAGYPRIQDTVSILLAMQAGGADIIEVGMPFSDPIADGRAIQETNQVGTLKDYSLTPT
jgi:tryptophan synthase